MKRRAENHNIDDSLLLELFNQAMPVPVQTIGASISPVTSDKAAEVADRILAINPNSIHAVSSRGEGSPSSMNERRSTTDLLREEIQALRKEVADLRQFRTQSNSRRTRSQSLENKLCWYHFRFQDKAQKCVPSCSYKGNLMQEE
ncbi:hypothetical protein AVEN_188677-1 [Araneus ventricosus]|uniref:Uncharacterized protein n=1 Tax=Araneus ventricosus TaxID=182803 RepID=A0A4Y2DAB3_ARAVE|nr:hypothetical protein AVEN_188677-1 [Araneus ventricosus]